MTGPCAGGSETRTRPEQRHRELDHDCSRLDRGLSVQLPEEPSMQDCGLASECPPPAPRVSVAVDSAKIVLPKSWALEIRAARHGNSDWTAVRLVALADLPGRSGTGAARRPLRIARGARSLELACSSDTAVWWRPPMTVVRAASVDARGHKRATTAGDEQPHALDFSDIGDSVLPNALRITCARCAWSPLSALRRIRLMCLFRQISHRDPRSTPHSSRSGRTCDRASPSGS